MPAFLRERRTCLDIQKVRTSYDLIALIRSREERRHQLATMQNEYDFSNAERGKFHRKDAMLALPIYLDPEVREYLAARAKAKGIELDQLVNELLKHDIEIIEAAK